MILTNNYCKKVWKHLCICQSVNIHEKVKLEPSNEKAGHVGTMMLVMKWKWPDPFLKSRTSSSISFKFSSYSSTAVSNCRDCSRYHEFLVQSMVYLHFVKVLISDVGEFLRKSVFVVIQKFKICAMLRWKHLRNVWSVSHSPLYIVWFVKSISSHWVVMRAEWSLLMNENNLVDAMLVFRDEWKIPYLCDRLNSSKRFWWTLHFIHIYHKTRLILKITWSWWHCKNIKLGT